MAIAEPKKLIQHSHLPIFQKVQKEKFQKITISLSFKTMYLLIFLTLVAPFTNAHSRNGIVKNNTDNKETAHPDKVGQLPLVDFPLNFNHYSGYLDSILDIKLHYWFFESQNKPETDPLVLWLNGGPGCSSLMGAFNENGPIITKHEKDGWKFVFNEYAWNRNASLLYLESPINVGFSRSNGSFRFENSDELVVKQNVASLRSFYDKFPSYKLQKNDFYITGESYAGRYIPQLSVELLKENFPPNFKGVAIGNGLFDNDNAQTNLFGYTHGILDSPEDGPEPERTLWTLSDNNISIYNILEDDNQASDFSLFSALTQLKRLFLGKLQPGLLRALERRREKNDDYDDGAEEFDVNCENGKYLTRWLNRGDVQRAAHVALPERKKWRECGGWYDQELTSVAPQVKEMLEGGLKVVIYNGDLDAACNFIGAEVFIEKLGYKVVEKRSAWRTDSDQSVGGFSKKYEKGLFFTTVRGAGHLVPTDKPEAALKIFNQFLLGLKA